MNNLFQITQSNVKETNVPASFINKLYKMVKRQETHEDAYIENSNFIGKITTPKIFQEYLNTINDEFPLLEIIPEGLYILFEDEEVNRILANNIGDTIGTTVDDVENVRSWNRTWFHQNTVIENFNELSKFTNLRTLVNYAFYRCTSLKSVSIANLDTVNTEAFFQCTALKTVYAPNVLTIENRAFSGCTALSNATFTNVKTIGNDGFRNCDLNNSDLGHNIISIGNNTFYGSNIIEIDLSNTTSIGGNAFQNCSNLSDINSDLSQLTSLGQDVFSNCQNLSNDIVLSNITSLSARVFLNCKQLKNVSLPIATSIGNEAFANNSLLTNLNAPNITSIGNSSFINCSSLSSVLLTNLQTINANAFQQCNLSNANLGNNIKTINQQAFEGSKIQLINLSNAETIDKQAFINCKQLTSIGTDLSNANIIGESAFCNCENLTGDFVLTNITTLSSKAFRSTKITSVDLSNVTTFALYSWEGIFQGCTSLHTVILNPNMKSLPPLTFNGCTSLVNIDISNIEEFIVSNNQAGHFTNCSSLRSITLNNNLTSLPNRCFFGCSSLTSVTIPASVTYIGSEQFKNCTGLQSMTILATTPPELYNQNNGYNQIFSYPNTYPIYVPAESVELYKTTQYWSFYANRIQAIPNT